MPEVAAAEMAAGVASAIRLDRIGVLLVYCIADIEHTRPREQMRIPSMPRGHHAIEHDDAAPHRFEDVLRSAHAHEIARFVRRHVRHQAVEHPDTLDGGFADREAADRKTLEADVL